MWIDTIYWWIGFVSVIMLWAALITFIGFVISNTFWRYIPAYRWGILCWVWNEKGKRGIESRVHDELHMPNGDVYKIEKVK